MNKVRMVCAILLALPLDVFGANYLVELFPMPDPPDDGPGSQLLLDMRAGGLMVWISISHVVVGAMLPLPQLRFLGALLQFPITLGILAFHATMLPAGLGPAIGMTVLNGIVLLDGPRLRALFSAQQQAD